MLTPHTPTTPGAVDLNTIALSPFDQTIPRLYVHKLFCFPFPDPNLRDIAVNALQQALSVAILKWPFIIGHVAPIPDDEFKVKLEYRTPTAGEIGDHVLTVRDLSAPEWPWAYDQLAEAGMPGSAMNMDVLSILPEWPNPGETYPALNIQANFMEGGLILCFAFHHAVADGASFCTFLKAFANAIKQPLMPEKAMLAPVANRLKYDEMNAFYGRPLDNFSEYNTKSAKERHPRYYEITNRILAFSPSTVQQLEQRINDELKENPAGPSFASNIACLSALIWITVVRARRARLQPHETTRMGIAVNVRSIMKPALPEDYFGNAVVHTNAFATVTELLDGDYAGNLAPISTITLALAAARMRLAVQRVDAKYVTERFNTFTALADPTETSKAYATAMDIGYTGLDFSSWRDQGADIEFDIPGAGTSSVHFWRKAHSPNEGAYNILPRKGGSKGTADWEVSLGLGKPDMEAVCSELKAWTTKIID
jgi:trichothecene 3-O-acetyltransferase